MLYYGAQAEEWDVETLAYRTGVAMNLMNKGVVKLL